MGDIDIAAHDFCDYPTGWAIQRAGLTHLSPRCSAAQTDGAFLCDCGALLLKWKQLRITAGLSHDSYDDELHNLGIDFIDGIFAVPATPPAPAGRDDGGAE